MLCTNKQTFKKTKKHLADAKEWVAEEKREDYARAKTRKEIYSAV